MNPLDKVWVSGCLWSIPQTRVVSIIRRQLVVEDETNRPVHHGGHTPFSLRLGYRGLRDVEGVWLGP